MSTKVLVLEKHQAWSDAPVRNLSRSRARMLVSEDVAELHPTDRTIIRLKIPLRVGQSDPLRMLIAKYATLDRGKLLPPLEWYFPFTNLPLWLIQSYRQHKLAA